MTVGADHVVPASSPSQVQALPHVLLDNDILTVIPLDLSYVYIERPV